MAAVQRFKLKQTPTDVWSTRERLCLASSVMRSGDQNWVSVSRAIKPFGESNRPADWFSQKNCALQYSDLLEKVETPKRKRGERTEVETPGECIVRKLTLERIDELKRVVVQERQQYKKYKDELEMVMSGNADDRLQTIWSEILEEKKKKIEANAAHEKWLQDREVAKLAAAASLRLGKIMPKKQPTPVQIQQPQEVSLVTPNRLSVGRQNSLQSEPGANDVEVAVHYPNTDSSVISTTEAVTTSTPVETVGLTVSTVAPHAIVSTTAGASAPHHSPLLNNLLRNNSSHSTSTPTTPTHGPCLNVTAGTPPKETSPRSQLSLSSPTITSLLSSSPNISTSLTSSVVNLFTTALGGTQPTDSDTIHTIAKPPVTSPSQGAPTLLKLLDMPLGAPGKLPPLPILTTELDALPGVSVAVTTPVDAVSTTTDDIDSVATVKVEKLEEPTQTVDVEIQPTPEPSTVDVPTSTVAMPQLVLSVPVIKDDSIVKIENVKQEQIEHSEDAVVFVEDVKETEIDFVIEDVVESVETRIENDTKVVSDDKIASKLLVENEVKESDAVIVEVKSETRDDVPILNVEINVEAEESKDLSSNVDPKDQDNVVTTVADEVSPLSEIVVPDVKQVVVVDSVEKPPLSPKVLQEATATETSPDEICKTRSDDEQRQINKEEDSAAFLSVTSKTTNEDEEEEDEDVGEEEQDEDEEEEEEEDEDEDWDGSRMSTGTNESIAKGNKKVRKESETSERRFTRGRGQGNRESNEYQTYSSTSKARNKEDSGRSSLRLASAKKVEEESGPRSTRLTRSRREESSMVSTPTSTMTRRRRDPMKGKGKEQPHPSLFTKRDDDDYDGDGGSEKAALSSGRNRDDGTDGSGREDDLCGARSSHTMDSIPNSPSSTSFCGDDPESVRDYKLWKKSIMLVWRSAANHKFANVFLHAVTEEMAPGYRSVVYRPMDLITIKKNIENGAIKTTSEFQRDVMLMFQNAIMYNNSDHDVCKMAIDMEKEVMPHIQDYLATQLMVQSTVVPKTLRRETREQSQKRGDVTRDKEDVESSKRKRVSSEGSFELRDSKRRRTRADD